MSLVFAPRVKETTETTSTGTYSLAGSANGFQGFVAGIGNTNTTWYCCTDDINWEIGIGTVTDSSPDTLSRDTIVMSTNNNAAVNWGSGSKNIFCVFPYKLLHAIQVGITASNEFLYPPQAPGSGSISIGTATCSGSNSVSLANSGVCSSDYSSVVGYNNDCRSTCHVLGANHTVVDSLANTTIALGVGAQNNVSDETLFIENTQKGYAGILQARKQTGYVETTDATTTGINITLAPALSTTATIVYQILVVARQRDGSSGNIGDSKAWKIDVLVYYVSGTPTRQGTTAVTVIEGHSNASTWTFAIDFSQEEPLQVTGQANKTIRWAAWVRGIEVCDYIAA